MYHHGMFDSYSQDLLALLFFIVFVLNVILCVSVTAPRAWNRLPTEQKLLQSTTSFSHQLKTFLFQSAYGHWDID